MNKDSILNILYYCKNNPGIREWCTYALVILLLMSYRKIRIGRWREILGNSVEYHKFHLSAIVRDSSTDEKSRELAQALFWGVTRQLQSDIEGGRGGKALWRSFIGDKTALNTCSSVYYECSRYFRFIDVIIIKLNDTLISTLYRIFLLESYFSVIALFYMDLTLLYYKVTRPESGTGRLYLEMRGGIKNPENNTLTIQ